MCSPSSSLYSSSSSSSSPSTSLFGSPAAFASSSSASSNTSSANTNTQSMSTTRSSGTGTSRLHPFSLLPRISHPPTLLALVGMEITPRVIDYTVSLTFSTVSHALQCSDPDAALHPYLAPFESFVRRTLIRAEVAPPTLLAALTYLVRARPLLAIAAPEYALERIFLGASVSAGKYVNDSTLKNAHWALCCGLFGTRDVGRVEREFLGVLEWELGVWEADILAIHADLVEAGVVCEEKEMEMGMGMGAMGRMTGSKDAPINLTVDDSPASSPVLRTLALFASASASSSPGSISSVLSSPLTPAFFSPAIASSTYSSPRTPASPAYRPLSPHTPYPHLVWTPPCHKSDPDVPMDMSSPTFCPYSPTLAYPVPLHLLLCHVLLSHILPVFAQSRALPSAFYRPTVYTSSKPQNKRKPSARMHELLRSYGHTGYGNEPAAKRVRVWLKLSDPWGTY